MRKILFVLCTLGICSQCFSVEVKEIIGPRTVTPGSKYSYKIVFDGKLAEPTQFIVTIDNNAGLFNNGKSSFADYISAGKSEIELPITWDPDMSGSFTITAGRSGGYPKKETISLYSPNTDMQGAFTIVEDELLDYSILEGKYYYPPKWTVDNKYLSIISGQGTHKIRVKGLRFTERTTISVTTYLYSGGTRTRTMDIKVEPNFKITAQETSICDGSQIAYSIQDPQGATIQWAAQEKITYISGQGASTAKFKVSGNGYAKVKATVVYKGKTYNLENSDVWVGKPMSPDLSGFPLQLYAGAYREISLANTQPGTTYKWNITGVSDIYETDNHVSFRVNQFHYDGAVSITVVAKNKCGESTATKSIPVKGLGGGNTGGDKPGLVYPEMSVSLDLDKPSRSIYNIKIYNLTGSLVYSEENVSTDFNIHNTTLSDGIYIIEKSAGENRTTEKVILKR